MQFAQTACQRYQNDPTRLLDILIHVQSQEGYISQESIGTIARNLELSIVEVEQTLTFYHFFRTEPPAKINIYLNNSAVAEMNGRRKTLSELENLTGASINGVSPDGMFAIYDTSCIGMNDQEPAAIINDRIFTHLTPESVRFLVERFKKGDSVEELSREHCGGEKNCSEHLHTMVKNNIQKRGALLDPSYTPGEGLRALAGNRKSPQDVIADIKRSSLRGRGGAGFSTGLKWELCSKSEGEKRYVFCNADEGEPGTFKDRVILTEFPEMVFEGMTIAGYAIGSDQGILYLRYEYKYMEDYLNSVLQNLREKKLLGTNIAGIEGFHFDIRIQFGAGAYVCGEESALIESAEGKRGEPRDRPPFPVEKGYLGLPTIVNNVETLCSVVKILHKGPEWYSKLGTEDSTGTKLLSVSGDCENPGIYEIEWGYTIQELLEMVGARDTKAVQVGGPSGMLIDQKQFDRTLCFSDLATGGSMIVIGSHRDILKDIVLNFTDFFIEESCGSCVPCRTLPLLMREPLQRFIDGNGSKQDLNHMKQWSGVMKTNRCGLGQTALNPILGAIENFPEEFEKRMNKGENDLFKSSFDLNRSLQRAAHVTGREIPGEQEVES